MQASGGPTIGASWGGRPGSPVTKNRTPVTYSSSSFPPASDSWWWRRHWRCSLFTHDSIQSKGYVSSLREEEIWARMQNWAALDVTTGPNAQSTGLLVKQKNPQSIPVVPQFPLRPSHCSGTALPPDAASRCSAPPSTPDTPMPRDLRQCWTFPPLLRHSVRYRRGATPRCSVLLLSLVSLSAACIDGFRNFR